MVIASWQPPKKPAGHSNYFEVGIVETDNNEFNNMDSKSRDSSLCRTKISKIDNYYHSDCKYLSCSGLNIFLNYIIFVLT